MIFIPYQPQTSLKEGIDTLSMYQNFKLRKALSQIEIGSRFMDKSAIAKGLKDMGLFEMAAKYEVAPEAEQGAQGMTGIRSQMVGDEYLKAEAREKELGKKLATEAALSEFLKGNQYNPEFSSDTRLQMGMEAAERSKSLDTYKKDIAIAKAQKEFFKDKVEAAKQEKNEGFVNVSDGEIDYSKLSTKVLSNPNNIEKLIYSAPDGIKARARMAKLLSEMVKRKGGLDAGDLAVFQEIDRGLHTYYGQSYKPMNFSAYLKQTKSGGGGKTKDYVVLVQDREGIIKAEQVSARNAEQAKLRMAKKYGTEDVQVYKGTMDTLAILVEDYVKAIKENPILAKEMGYEIKKGWFGLGSPKLLKGGKEVAAGSMEMQQDILRRLINLNKTGKKNRLEEFGADKVFSGK